MQIAERREMHSSLAKIDQQFKETKMGFSSFNKIRKDFNNYIRQS